MTQLDEKQLYRIRLDGTFYAYDVDDALLRLAHHFLADTLGLENELFIDSQSPLKLGLAEPKKRNK